MRRLSRTIPRMPPAALLLAAFVVTLVAGHAHADPRATLITVGPGDAVWEQFGHNMIRLVDPDSGFDACYNWGLFDFDQPHFVANFVRGRMLYSMGALSTQRLFDEYHDQHRRVTEQPLDLTPTQLHDLIVRCETNRRPENAPYRYDYFKDNCSTRVRDMLDGVTGGAIGRVTRGRPVTPAVTFRSQTVRLMQADFWVSLGTDFAMGPAGDTPLDAWADGFLPGRVSDDATAAGVAGPATLLWPTDRAPEPAAPPTRWPGLLAAGAALAAGILGLSRWRPWAGRAAAAAWWAVSGVGGAFLVFMWACTDHAAAHANQNLWHYSPLAGAVLAAMLWRGRRTALRLAVAIGAVSLVGAALKFGGVLSQQNAGFVLLALPINLAAARALTTARPADEVTGDDKADGHDGGTQGGTGGGNGGAGDGGVRERPLAAPHAVDGL